MKVKIHEKIKKTKSGYFATSKSGKHLSKKAHKTKKDAVAQLAAVEISKKERKNETINQILDELEYDVTSLKPKAKLNRKLWDKNRRLDPKTADKLIKIAEDFATELDIKDKIKDVTFTGSLASYNWHKKSDIDLHILINYEDFDEDPDVMKQLFDSLRSNWNRKHTIMIRGHEVEIYIQDEDEPHHANGVYSISDEEWLIKPLPIDTELDLDGAMKKAEGVEKDIEDAKMLLRGKRFLDSYRMSEKIKEKIRNLRSTGLKGEGIFSVENLAFKILRNSHQLDILDQIYTDSYDKMMSISSMSRDIDIEMLDEEQLNEKLMLKPGPNGWDLYSELVAKAYLAAPKFESRAVPHFQAMIPFVERMFKQIQSKVDVKFVNYHAYENVEQLRSDVFNKRIMKIATVDAEHDIFDPETNAKFRAVHDFMSHIQAIGSKGTDFSLKGEIQSYNAHIKTMPPASWPALFTEIVGQASTYFYQGGKFGEQKIALLDGFDYENIGVVDGYDIVNKELVKKDSIEEMYSTSTQTGGHRQAKVSPEEEFKGHKERSDRQGLQNFKNESKKQGIDKHIDAEIQDSGEYQTKTIKNYNQDRKDYLFLGNNKETGGGSGHKTATMTRSKSAPPMAEDKKEKKRSIKIKINKKR